MQDAGPQNTTMHLNVLDTLPIMILDVDRYGNLLFANKKARDQLGIPPATEDIMLEHILSQESINGAMKHVEQLFSGEGDVTATWRLNTPGVDSIVNANAIAIVENDYPIRVRVFMHNLSEAAQETAKPVKPSSAMATDAHSAASLAESAAQSSVDEKYHEDQEYLNALLQKSGLLVYLFDTRSQLIEVNRRFIELTGYSLNQVSNITELLNGLYPDKEVQDQAHRMHADMFKAKHAKDHVLDVHTRSGETRHISWSSGAIRSSDGKLRGFIVIGIDVSDRKQLEHSLKLQADLLTRVTDAVVILDRKSHIVRWLGNAENLFGYKADEVRGKPFCDLFPAEKRKIIHDSLVQGIQTDGKWAGSILMQEARGRPIAVRVDVSLLLEGKTMIGMVAIMRDQTREKQLESAYRKATGKSV